MDGGGVRGLIGTRIGVILCPCSSTGKLFALDSGILVLVASGILFLPLYHRILHKFHLELEEREDS